MVQCGPIWLSVHGFFQPRSGSLLTALTAGALKLLKKLSSCSGTSQSSSTLTPDVSEKQITKHHPQRTSKYDMFKLHYSLTCQTNISSSMRPSSSSTLFGTLYARTLAFTFPALEPKRCSNWKQCNLSPPGIIKIK